MRVFPNACLGPSNDTLSLVQEALTNAVKTCKGGECLDSVRGEKSVAVLFDPDDGGLPTLPGSSESGPQGLGTYRDAGAGDSMGEHFESSPVPGKEPSFPFDFHWRVIMPIRIVLADDHVLVRQGLKSLLEREKFPSCLRKPPMGKMQSA